MATALGVAPSDADRRALTAYNLHSASIGRFVGFNALHARAQLDGGSCVVRRRPVFETDLLEMVRPNGQSSTPGTFAVIAAPASVV